MSSKVNLKAQVVISIFLVLLGSTVSAGRIIKVPLEFDNIQAAIDYANDGDMILVSSGTYRGQGNRDIDFAGKAIIVRSIHGPTNCIIDCQGSADEQHLGFFFQSGEGPSSVLDGFTITNGYHEEAGAILCTYVHIGDFRPSSPTITNCVITNNHGTYAGAVRCTSGCEPVISNCVISDNTGFYTGGLSYADECRPVVSNCIIRGNRGQTGGGIRTGGARCHGTISNCVISGNSATDGGAGVHWWAYGGSVEITNCTIAGNEGQLWTAGICIGGGGGTTGTITNCIIRGNRVRDWPFAQIYLWADANPPTTAEVTYCNVEGGWPGEGNINADPLFVDSDGADDLHLLGGSPCLDAGDNSAIPAWMTKDVEGNPRIVNGTVDMGAYEGPNQGFLMSTRSVAVPEGQTAAFTVALALDPQGAVEVTIAIESGDPDISVQSGTILTFNSSNFSQAQPVTLAAAEDGDYIEGTAVVSVSTSGFNTLLVNVTEAENEHVLYVDANAPGANTGMSWADAFESLQEALSAAAENPPINEIRVAHGTYKPDQGAGIAPGDREASFELVNGVDLKGGYAGWGKPDPDARDIEVYETILSGDLDGNDVDVNDADDLFDEPTRAENSYHVVTGNNTDANAILDGFTIAAGNANNGDLYSLHQLGGGMYNYESSPTVTACTFARNSARSGGGMYNMGSRPTLRNCSFIGNSARRKSYSGGNGGGMCTYSNSCVIFPEVANCVFEGNSATSGGGISSGSQLVVRDCIFKKNRGGGFSGTATELKDCVFTSNQGGGIFIGSDSHLTNCLFTGNIGGGLQAQDCDIVVTNCSFIGNITSAFFAGIWNDEGDTTVTNCISWGNIGQDGVTESAQIATHDPAVINYCCIQGWSGALGGTGNTGADPCFVSERYWDRLPDYNDDYWERHIHWSGGDYHLKSQGGRWDANEGRWTKDDVTSLCIDAGDMASPIGYEPFPNGGIINMGAYGGTVEASKSYFGEPVCEIIVAGDINGDCIVNSVDFALMAGHWLENNNP